MRFLTILLERRHIFPNPNFRYVRVSQLFAKSQYMNISVSLLSYTRILSFEPSFVDGEAPGSVSARSQQAGQQRLTFLKKILDRFCSIFIADTWPFNDNVS